MPRQYKESQPLSGNGSGKIDPHCGGRWTTPTEIWPISITTDHRRHQELLEITIIMEGIDKFTTHSGAAWNWALIIS